MDQNEHLHAMRHTAAHVLAAAVSRLYPTAKFGVGPVVENGFFYDIWLPEPLAEDSLKQIEKEMGKIVREGHEMVRKELSIDSAIEFFRARNQDFKVELLTDLKEKGTTSVNPDEAQDVDVARPDTASIYETGEFTDLCRGPHVGSTKELGAFKLVKIAGAYWRGEEENPQMQRIYGLCFAIKEELDAYLLMLEEAKKRDHRKLGPALGLFAFHEYAPGAAFWLPNGTTLYTTLQDMMRRLVKKNGYVEVKTPLLYNKKLWETSGHWGKYKENMFLVLDSETDPKLSLDDRCNQSLKPMNCPSHHLMYSFTKRSYRDLPLRIHSQDVLHRNEASGTLGGLTRVRQFAQDDAHIYLMESQITEEVLALVRMIDTVYKAVGMEYTAKFATRPEQKIGDDALWDRAEGALKAALEATGLKWELKPGDGAFYGPKIDFEVTDSIGRKWQLATIQLDYNAPERFDLNYIGDDNADHRPVVIHRAIYGSFERFIAILTEHYAGAFPMWLAPVQVRLASVSEAFIPFSKQLQASLIESDIRVELDDSNEKVGKKIRNSAMMKIPWTIVIGEKEAAGGAFQVKVFGSEESIIIEQKDLLDAIKKASMMPV